MKIEGDCECTKKNVIYLSACDSKDWRVSGQREC